MKTILKKVPDEHVYYDLGEVVELDLENIIIYGNRQFRGDGDKELLNVVKGDYYDDEVGYDYEVLDQLKKLTNKEWHVTTIKGYSQGDWQEVYYTDKISDDQLQELEDFYFGKVDEFRVCELEDDKVVTDVEDLECDYIVYVPHDVVWKGKKSICEYLGLTESTTTILETDGYVKVYKYKEIE